MRIKVTASVEYVYDTDDTENFGVSNPGEAIDDVWEMVASGELSPSDFTYDWVEVD